MKNFLAFTLLLLLFICPLFSHSQLWKQYSDSAKGFSEQRNIDKAIEFYTKAKEELKKDSFRTIAYADVSDSLAMIYTNSGNYEKAEPFFLESKKVREKIMGKTHIDYGTSCQNLARLYRLMGQYQKAEALYLEARKIIENAVGINHIKFAGNCNGLANLYGDMGEYDKSEPLYRQFREIIEKIVGKESPEYATSCDNMAILYRSIGQYQKAEALHLEAKQILEKVLGKDNIKYAINCNSLGNFYFDIGQYKNAEPLFKEAMQKFEKLLGNMHPNYAISCNNLAVLYMYTGQYEKAEYFYLEAKKIRESMLNKEHPDYAQSCNDLANLYSEMGQYQQAETLYLRAIQIREKLFGKNHPDYIQSCNNLAILYAGMNQYNKAEALFLISKANTEKLFGKNNADYAVSCINLGNLYMDIGKHRQAEPLYLQAKKLFENTVGKEHPDYASACQNTGRLYLLSGQYQRAEPLLLEAKQIREKILGKEHLDYSESCQNLGTLYWNLKKVKKADELYKDALQSQNARVKKLFQFTSEQEKNLFLKTVVNLRNNILSFNISTYPHSSQGLSYDLSLSYRNLTLSSSQQIREAIYTATDTSIKNRYDIWIDTREQLSFWYSKPTSDRPDYVKDLEVHANTLEKELTVRSFAFKKEQLQDNITWKNIQEKLKPNEAAIEFVNFTFYNGKRWTDSTYYFALLLKRDLSEPMLIPLFESKQMAGIFEGGNTLNTVSALYSAGKKPNPAFGLIWQPIEKYLKDITRIYYAPAGILHRISFAALPVNEHEFLNDKYQLIQLNTTASIVNQSDDFIDGKDSIVLYGGILYDVDSSALKRAVAAFSNGNMRTRFLADENTTASTWKYLPGTEKEVAAIQIPGNQKGYAIGIISGVAASEESLKALNGSSSPAVLHIATHGFFFPDPKKSKKENVEKLTSGSVFKLSDNPLFRSGLLFAGANNAWAGKPINGVEDGILTAYEVSNLYLPNTKLVVLSACETGLGDIQGNEGVYGLQRSFKMTGVENLVMSLWKVPDHTTAEFMQEFYKGIFDKQSISNAFTSAQTMMKNRYRKEPYKWAAWILVK